ncbi:MAG: hypothetical protein JSW29_02895 [Candidatus Bathyarchaeota archaeon]|nr:MAG: hypothetical protein JSW29_02895 [Candidatus Bathyarchaeota archaeon]
MQVHNLDTPTPGILGQHVVFSEHFPCYSGIRCVCARVFYNDAEEFKVGKTLGD